jgi:hypothetical protein
MKSIATELVNDLEDVFSELKKECEELEMTKDRMTLLRIIEIEAKAGLPFADKLKRYFPEVVK